MNLLRHIFGSKSPTQDWIADPTIPLHVNLESRRFCGVELGADVDRLKHLGPSSNLRGRNAETILVYEHQGFQLFLEEKRRLGSVDINLVAEAGMAAFTGSWSFQGQPVSIEASQTPLQIEALLGTADQKDTKYGVVLGYQHSQGDIWFEWGENGQLENVMLDKAAQ